MISQIFWSDVMILCSSIGTINLSHLEKTKDIQYVSDDEIMIRIDNADTILAENLGYIYVPTIPSPDALAKLLTFQLKHQNSLGLYEIVYDSKQNNMTIQSTRFPENSHTLNTKLIGNDLCKLLGYPSQTHQAQFNKRKPNQEPSLNPNQDFDISDATDPPLKIPSEYFKGWMTAKINPGWYAPSQRPMCTGQPLRITQEFENAFNHLVFNIPERVPKGMPTAHFLIFQDSAGIQHNCSIMSGKYNAESFCNMLQLQMTYLANKTIKGSEFSVFYDTNSNTFTFSLEIKKSDNKYVPAKFCLLFDHPACIDGTKLGFANISLKGCDSYTSDSVYIPSAKYNDEKGHYNSYRISEIGHQKRFILEGLSPNQMTGLIKHYNPKTCELIVQTFVGQLPYSHGLTNGDVIRCVPTSKTELFVFNENTYVTNEFESCQLEPSAGKNGIVSQLQVRSDEPHFQYTHLQFKVKHNEEIHNCVGQVISIQQDVEPFNICFTNLPRSVKSSMFGFGHGALQWGIDGTLKSNDIRVPPFIAEGVHSLDHPDYILIYITEGKKGTNLQHTYSDNATTPFAKLVLYPMFREERMLPRDTTLLGSELMNQFTLVFKNPDGSPYHFHNAEFSFSLNFIKVAQNE
jgi:hypothetical protein